MTELFVGTATSLRSMTIDLARGGRLILTSHREEADPALFCEAVKAAWRKAVEQGERCNNHLTLIGKTIREFFAPWAQELSTACGGETLSPAQLVGRLFQIEVEAACPKCQSHQVRFKRGWSELRNVLAPAGLPQKFAPKEILPSVPDEIELQEYLASGGEFWWAKYKIDCHISTLARYVCVYCVEAARTRLQEQLNEQREAIEERGRRQQADRESEHRAEMERRAAAERRAQEERERIETENPRYVLSAFPAATACELGPAVSDWIARGYRVWGPPLALADGRVAQALVRADGLARKPGRPKRREEARGGQERDWPKITRY